MSVTRAFGLVEDPRYRDHRSPEGHPERPERLLAVADAIAPVRERMRAIPARPASDDELLRIHTSEHLAQVAEAVSRAPAQLDPDTFVSAASLQVARLAAGGAIDLALAVARGELTAGLAAVRPPGHHAEAARPMGFCLFNNVALAARALQAEERVGRILILDWDVHHGNGTQHAFESDPSIYYVSTHQFPYYPGSGDFGEVGIGRGEGTTLNVPLPAGAGDPEYLGVLQRLLVPAARHFAPDVILVSAGFDAHASDPLAAMQVSSAGYLAMTTLVRQLADELCEGRLAFVLEGGYAAQGLREGVSAVLAAGLALEAPALPAPVAHPAGSVLDQVLERAVGIHRRWIPDLGAQ